VGYYVITHLHEESDYLSKTNVKHDE